MNLPVWLPTLPSPPFFTQLTQRHHIYIRQVFVLGSILKYILIAPASTIYALIVLNTKGLKNQYQASLYGSTFEAVPIGGSLEPQPISATPLVWLRLAPTILCICLVILLCVGSSIVGKLVIWAALKPVKMVLLTSTLWTGWSSFMAPFLLMEGLLWYVCTVQQHQPTRIISLYIICARLQHTVRQMYVNILWCIKENSLLHAIRDLCW